MTIRREGQKKIYWMEFEINGVRVHRSTGKYDRKEAMKVEAEAKLQILQAANPTQEEGNIKPVPKSIPCTKSTELTLEAAFDRCYDETWYRNKSGERNLQKGEKIVSIIGNKYLSELTNVDMIQIKNFLFREGASEGTVNRYFASLKTVLNRALKVWGAIGRLPYIEMEEEAEGRERYIEYDEEIKIINYFLENNQEFMSNLMQILIDTGMRLGEGIRLQFSNNKNCKIDFDQEYIIIFTDKEKKKKTIPMTDRVKTILSNLKETCDKPFPFNNDYYQKRWRKMRIDLGFDNESDPMVLHSLRHTCASRLVQDGHSLQVAKEMLGHSTIQVTERYGHLEVDNLRSAVKHGEQKRIRKMKISVAASVILL